MELHQLRYFVAVAEVKNFTRAAKRCFVSQPSLSQQVRKLEDQLGQPLFDRLGQRAEMTAAGKALYDRAKEILLQVDEAARAVRDQKGGGRVRLGILPSIGPYLLPEFLQRVRKSMPDSVIEINEDFRGSLAASMLDGGLDVLVASLPPEHPDLEVEILLTEPLLVAIAAADRLAKKPAVAPADLAGGRLVLLGDASSLGLQTRRFFGDHQIPMEISCRCAQVKTVKSLVASGLGIAIVPRMATGPEDAGVVYRTLAGVHPRREIVLIRHRRRFRSGAEEAFVEALRAFCREHWGRGAG